MKNRILLTALVISLMVPLTAFCKPAQTQNEKTATAFFDSIRTSPPMLRGFLTQMPKGADLHNHLSGAIYAEDYLQWAMDDKRCIDTKSFAIVSTIGKNGAAAQCPEGTVPAAGLEKDSALYSAAVNALSTRNMDTTTRMWGHDQFFNTFGKFGASKQGRDADLLTVTVQNAARQNILYLELMDSIYPDNMKSIAERVGWSGDAATTYAALKAAGLFDGIPQSIATRNQTLAKMRASIGDGPGKDTTVRFIQQVTRTANPASVFAQIAYDFELVKQDPNVVAFNLVAPEDNYVALRDYALHMSMINALYSMPQYTGTAITLHAGELTLGLVPPRQLSFHIRDAVENGHARRIGHGVDIMYEENPFALLRTMQKKNIAVEICLSSNDQILHVSGADHPFSTYRDYGVPVVLNTDDEGVERVDLTNEYVRATQTYKLSYDDIKALSRSSLEYSFLPGQSIWAAPGKFELGNACKDSLIEHETAPCTKLLTESAKAQMQWNLEKAFTSFERDVSEAIAPR